MLVTKDNGDTFTIKAGDFKTAWKHVERIEEVEQEEIEVTTTNFEL